MKISELIDKLGEKLEKSGDREVRINTEFGLHDFNASDVIEYHELLLINVDAVPSDA